MFTYYFVLKICLYDVFTSLYEDRSNISVYRIFFEFVKNRDLDHMKKSGFWGGQKCQF